MQIACLGSLIVPKLVKYNPFVPFPVLHALYCLFAFFQRAALTSQPIFMVYGSNDVVLPKNGPFGG